MADQRNFRERIADAFPVFSSLLTHRVTYKPLVKFAIATGAAAGQIAVSGILRGDELVSVLAQNTTSYLLSDVTSEFVANTITTTYNGQGTIAADGYIDNTGGTTTSGSNLLVVWLTWENR